jgi:hypothetical protein
MSLKDMRDELRALRKESVKPVSRMKKGDVLLELEKLRGKREDTPPVASTVGAKPKKMAAKIDDIKVSKEKEFPVKPVEEKKKNGKKSSGMAVGKSAAADCSDCEKKPSKMERLMKMIDEMSDDE